MNYLSFFPGKYLRASDIEGDTPVTISKWKPEDIQNQEGRTEKHVILSFPELERGLVLNKTNGDAIAALYGPDMDQWIGKKICLVVRDVEAFGKLVPAIRIRKPTDEGSQSSTSALPAEPSDSSELAF